LPTYNRARFLRQALASIESQTYRNWELLVVDDGSTDESRELLREWSRTVSRPYHYVFQENQGAYAARNTGLALSRADYIAFFDSDDEWLPHHLQDCVTALDTHPNVDWVYGACRMVHVDTKREIAPNTFYVNGTPRPFLKLQTVVDDSLHIIRDKNTWRCAVLHGLYCGLQNSVMRRTTFADQAFSTTHRNEAEDQLATLRALVQGGTFAYFDKVHVIYHVHESNSSAAATNQDLQKRTEIMRALLLGFENLRRDLPLTTSQRRAINQRLGQEYFWRLGYALLWQHGRQREALAMFRRGLNRWPWDLRCWKTYCLAAARHGLSQLRQHAGQTA
jgi:glycosyltransferase involved in cell wall biosynthesis